jgi:hypothetical protein
MAYRHLHTMRGKKPQPLPHTLYKMNSLQIRDLKLKTKTVKLLFKNGDYFITWIVKVFKIGKRKQNHPVKS